ncbi:MAG: hypothetical protein CL607_06740 [Anaerolineaceae bacterium]|nr:hypothetical protein [Anaerolineaceae bacterium]
MAMGVSSSIIGPNFNIGQYGVQKQLMSTVEPTRVLYMEDDAGLAGLLKRRLRRHGYAVDIAPDGEVGLQMVDDNGYDLLLVDYNLPVLSGLEIIRTLTKRSDYPPLIMLTGAGNEALAVEAIQCGASNYVVKDNHGNYFEMLPTVIENALENKRLAVAKRKAQDALKRYEVLIEKSSELTTVLDAMGRLTYVSSSVLQVLGIHARDLENKQLAELVHVDDRPIAETIVADTLKLDRAESTKAIYRVRNAADKWRWMETYATNLFDEPLIGGIVMHWRDVTTRVDAEQAVESSEKRYRTLFEQSNDAIIIMDLSGNLISVNQRAADMLGYDQAAMLEMTYQMLGRPEDRAARVAELESMQVDTTIPVAEITLMKSDGSSVPIERNMALVRDETGQPLHIQSIMRDISERKAAEAVLRESEERLRSTVLSLDDVVLLLDENGLFIDFYEPSNSSNFVALDKFLGKGIEAVLPPHAAAMFDEAVIRLRAEGQVQKFDYPLETRNSTLWFGVTLSTRYDVNDKPAGITVVARDITDRKLSEDRVRQSEERFRQLFELAPTGMVILNSAGELLRINRAFCELLGYTDAQLRTKRFDDIAYPADRGNLKVTEDATTTTFFHMECRLLRSSGQVVYTLIEATGINYLGGDDVYLLAQITDITDRKRAEALLNEYVTQLELLQQIEQDLNQTLVVEEVLKLACDTAMHLSLVECVHIALYDANTQVLKLGYSFNTPGYEIGQVLPPGTLAHTVARTSEAQLVENLPTTPYQPLYSNAIATISVPLITQSRLIGTLTLETNSAHLLNPDRFEFLRVLAGRMAIAIENADLYSASQQQLAELKQLHERLDHMAYHDALTDLPNRFMFEETLDQALKQADTDKSMLAVLFIDLDNFKQINDNLGHIIGDAVLQQVAMRLRQNTRENDVTARMGGDEFMVLVRDFETNDVAIGVAENILHALRQPYFIDSQNLYLSASIGMSFYPSDSHLSVDLLAKADSALYRSKAAGKNIFQVYDSDHSATSQEQFNFGNELRRALDHDEFVLYYQPQMDLNSGQITGLEALLRWQHPKRGLVMPGSFITVAEDRGMLGDIGDWILTELSRNQRQLADLGHQPQMAVNMAVSQFEQVDFVARLWRILEANEADPSRIEIEVTERSMLSDFDAAHYKLKELKGLGLKIALDDFGSGYSSLGYLQHLEIDTLKMDRSLIASMDENETDSKLTSRSRAITRSIITLGKNLGLSVVAEGVENEAQLDYLRENGCDIIQGYLVSKPLSLDDLRVWLDAREEVPVV